MFQKEIKLQVDCQSPVGCPSLLVFQFWLLFIFPAFYKLGQPQSNLLSSCPACNKNQSFGYEDNAPSIGSTVINPNVFLLSLELLAWLVQTNCYLAWTSNSLLAFPSRHSGSLENNQDISQFGWDKYVRENLLGVRLEAVWTDLERATD